MLRFRAGWLIPNQILALTHFVPKVSAEDFAGITQATEEAIAQVDGNFHLIIDNRIIDHTELASLDTMLQVIPQLNHPQLRWIVMILPEKLTPSANRIEQQHHKQISLTHVETIADAYQFLNAKDPSLEWSHENKMFFEQKE